MEEEDFRLSAEDFEAWKEELGGKLEELGDQNTVEEAFEKMRNGIWLHVYHWCDEELHIIRQVEMPEGGLQEHVFVFTLDKEDMMKLDTTYPLEWWTGQYTQYIGLNELTLTKGEAMEKLKAGIPIVTPTQIIFVSRIHNDGVPEVEGRDFVFVIDKDKVCCNTLYLSKPLEEYVEKDLDSYRYGYRKGGNDE